MKNRTPKDYPRKSTTNAANAMTPSRFTNNGAMRIKKCTEGHPLRKVGGEFYCLMCRVVVR